MAKTLWQTLVFLFIMHLQHVQSGNTYQSSYKKTVLGQPLIPCMINNFEEHTTGHESRRNVPAYEVSIATSWMRHKGCYLILQLSRNDTRQENRENYSPGLCSLICEFTDYFGLKMNICICLYKLGVDQGGHNTNCQAQCPEPWRHSTCGGLHADPYFDVFQHKIDVKQDPENQDVVNNTCMVARKKDKSTVIFKTVSCSDSHLAMCFLKEGSTKMGPGTNLNADTTYGKACSLFGDKDDNKINALPENDDVWTSIYRSKVVLFSRNGTYSSVMPNKTYECQLRIIDDFKTASIFVHAIDLNISLRCNLTEPKICTVLPDEDIIINDIEDIYRTLKPKIEIPAKQTDHATDYESSNQLTIGSEYSSDTQTDKKLISTTIETDSEPQSVSINPDVTPTYEFGTTNSTLILENSIFLFQIGIAISVSCLVILIASLGCCFNRPRRGTYTFPISRSEENIVMATEGPLQHTISTAALAENYSEPKDKASSSSEIEGPRFCATTPCQKTNYQKTENGEYHHLDFTLRSETAKRFADTSEYDHVRGNVVSVFDQPWDTATSKVNKLFSQISKSVVQKGQNVRKSFIKRRVSRSGSPKLKNRASDYCKAWKTQLNNQQFVLDSDVDNQSDNSIDVANSTVDSKDKPELRRTDSAFPVLPYSERINVKSTHIYDEPDDRRMSLRERLLHMISIRPLKMPFGIELDLRASRSKSKIYSLATSIEERDESVA